MSSGVFGTVRPANIVPSRDVEIFYHYTPSRGETSNSFNGYKKMNAGECLVRVSEDSSNTVINGLFQLRLPVNTFNKKGI